MRHERPYARSQRAVTYAGGSTRAITILLETADFDRLAQLATEHNVGNATLGRQIIRKFLERKDEGHTDLTEKPQPAWSPPAA